MKTKTLSRGKIKSIPVKKINPDVILTPGDLGKANFARKFFFENVEREKKGLPRLERTAKVEKEAYMEIYDSSTRIVKYLTRFAPTYSLMGNACSTDARTRDEERKHGIKLPLLIRDLKKIKNFYYPKNVVRRIGNLRVGFLEYFLDSYWIKEFGIKDKERVALAKRETPKAKIILEGFGDLDILVCHQPPYGILDEVTSKYAPEHWRGKHAGSKVILDYIRKYKPRYVMCGHIHEGKGKQIVGNTEVINVGFEGGYFVLNID